MHHHICYPQDEAHPRAVSIAIHPAGHFLAVGYTDGLVAFWAIADGKQPLYVGPLMATHKGQDIEYIDSDQEPLTASKDTHHLKREPLHKLMWCGFSRSDDSLGGETALLVLGGNFPGYTPGLGVHLMPAFDTTSSLCGESGSFHQTARDAMTQTLVPKKTNFISTSSAIRNFCVVPRESPHFSGAWDPVAVICILNTRLDDQILEAYRFPPRFFVAELAHPPSSSQSDIVGDFSQLLEEMEPEPSQEVLRLPTPLMSKLDEILWADTTILDNEATGKLSHGSNHDGLALFGGAAWMDATRVAQAKLSKVRVDTFHAIMILNTSILPV